MKLDYHKHMGILDKWKKKKEKEQLEAVEEAAQVNAAKADDKKAEKKEEVKKETKSATTKSKKTKKVEEIKVTVGGRAHAVLVRPFVSEKATTLEIQGKYVFVVKAGATKFEIKQAVKELYGVVPTNVRTMQFEGKRVRFGYTKGKRKDWKKAIVTVPKGHTIHIHEGV